MKINFCLLFIIMLTGCSDMHEEDLVGQWKASEVRENGMPLKVDINQIGFVFSGEGYYEYQSTLDYKEAGTWYINNSLLYTLDTLNEASTEKMVRINVLTKDSLYLQMNAEGKDKLMKFYKVGNR